MMLFKKLCFVAISFLLSAGLSPVLADAKSDYEYQYSKYRQNYIEYTILKKDYLENPTLDNQQRAVLSAKQTILSRDTTKAYFADYLLSLCQEKQTNYPPIKPFLDSLKAAGAYFRSTSSSSQSIITPSDLANFTDSYLTNSITHDRSFRTGVIACKISQLVRIQIESKNALDTITPKLATPFSTPLQNRINELQSLGNKINESIGSFTEKLGSEEEILNIDSENYFSGKSETLFKIKNQQLKWIDSLIDIDLNYAHS